MLHELRHNPALLKLDLYCKGIRLEESCLGEERDGLELILPGNLWTNVPVTEAFVAWSPHTLHREHGRYMLRWQRLDVTPVELAPRPDWYDCATAAGVPMSRIGTLRGNYLEIHQIQDASLDEVMEVIRAARDESGITYVSFSLGYSERETCLDLLEPFIVRIKRELGLLVGVQTPPHRDLHRYNHLREIGVNRVSFCFEVFDRQLFQETCPGKHAEPGLDHYLEAVRHCAALSRKGPRHEPWITNGEIIAGLEPPESSIRAIDWITSVGAVPTVYVFRPLTGPGLQHLQPPQTEDLVPVFRRLYEAVMEHGLLTDVAPNIHASLVMLPEECRYLSPNRYRWQSLKLKAMASVFARQFERRLSQHPD